MDKNQCPICGKSISGDKGWTRIGEQMFHRKCLEKKDDNNQSLYQYRRVTNK